MSVVEELEAVKAQLRKAKIELSTKLADLNATIVQLQASLEATGGVDVNVVAALADVKAAAQELDDLVPDVPLEAVGVDEDEEPEVPAEPVVEQPVVDAPVEEPVEDDGAALVDLSNVDEEPVPSEDVVPEEVPAAEEPTE